MYPTPDLSTITATRDAFEVNVVTLAVFLSAHRIASCSIEYRGSGDSGESEEQTFQPLDGDEISDAAAKEKLPYVDFRQGWSNEPPSAQTKESGVEAFLSEILDQALRVNNHSGYENNEGGGGTLTIHADGRWTHEHFDYVVTEEYDNTEGTLSERVTQFIDAQKRRTAESANASCGALLEAQPFPYAVLV